MSDDELNALVEYLRQNFGAVETKVNINKASAREIELVTGLRAADSAAIVRYRGAKGRCKGWRDLGKVEGIDKSRLEAAKDRITFPLIPKIRGSLQRLLQFHHQRSRTACSSSFPPCAARSRPRQYLRLAGFAFLLSRRNRWFSSSDR